MKEIKDSGEGGKERNLKTELGEITLTLEQIECKKCGKVFSPFLDVIGTVTNDAIWVLTFLIAEA